MQSYTMANVIKEYPENPADLNASNDIDVSFSYSVSPASSNVSDRHRYEEGSGDNRLDDLIDPGSSPSQQCDSSGAFESGNQRISDSDDFFYSSAAVSDHVQEGDAQRDQCNHRIQTLPTCQSDQVLQLRLTQKQAQRLPDVQSEVLPLAAVTPSRPSSLVRPVGRLFLPQLEKELAGKRFTAESQMLDDTLNNEECDTPSIVSSKKILHQGFACSTHSSVSDSVRTTNLKSNSSTPCSKSVGRFTTNPPSENPTPIDPPHSPRSSVSFNTSVRNFLPLTESRGDEAAFWKQLMDSLEEQKRIVKDKTDEVEVERSRRRSMEDDLTATRIKLKRLQKQSQNKPKPEETASPRNGGEQELHHALTAAQEEIQRNRVELQRARDRIESLAAELGEAESERTYLQKELEIHKERLNRMGDRAESLEQELKTMRMRWTEERHATDEKLQMELAELRRQLREKKISADELRDEYELERREFKEVLSSAQERLEMAEQELEKANRELRLVLPRHEEAQKQLVEKNGKIAHLKKELDLTQRSNQELESQLLGLEQSIVQRIEGERLGYQEKIEEMEIELDTAMKEVETLRDRLQETEDTLETVRKDCGRFQKALRQHAAKFTDDESLIATLKAELARERSAQEERLRAELEARTQTITQEMDSLIELRANERSLELRSTYEKDLMKLRHQLADVSRARLDEGNHRCSHGKKKGLEETVMKHGETLHTLGQGMAQVLELLARPAMDGGRRHGHNSYRRPSLPRKASTKEHYHQSCSPYHRCPDESSESDPCLQTELPRINHHVAQRSQIERLRHHQVHSVPPATSHGRNEKPESQRSLLDLVPQASVTSSSSCNWPQTDEVHHPLVISPHASRFRNRSSLEPRNRDRNSITKTRIRNKYESEETSQHHEDQPALHACKGRSNSRHGTSGSQSRYNSKYEPGAVTTGSVKRGDGVCVDNNANSSVVCRGKCGAEIDREVRLTKEVLEQHFNSCQTNKTSRSAAGKRKNQEQQQTDFNDDRFHNHKRLNNKIVT